MKRIVVLGLVVTMLFGTVACGGNTSDNQTNQGSLESTSTDETQAQINGDTEEELIEDNAEEALDEKNNISKPADINVSDISEVSREEKIEWMTYLFDALKNLDGETVSSYYTYDVTDLMNAIKADSEDLEFYNTIVGSMYYLPEYDIIIGKDPHYMLAMAYKEVYKDTTLVELAATNEENDEKWGMWVNVTRDFAKDILDRYWEEAPYIVLLYNASDNFYVNEGKFLCRFQYANMTNGSDSSYYDNLYLLDFINNPYCSVEGLNYGTLLFGTHYASRHTSYIPKGSYPQFFGKSELFNEENFYDIEAFLEVAKQMDEAYTTVNSSLYTDYLNNAPDDTNYNAFVESFNNGTYKMAVMDEIIMYYCLGNVNTSLTTYYYADSSKSEKIPLDDAFYAFCEAEGITFYEKVSYSRMDGKSCVIYPINYIALNMEQEGILTKYKE